MSRKKQASLFSAPAKPAPGDDKTGSTPATEVMKKATRYTMDAKEMRGVIELNRKP